MDKKLLSHLADETLKEDFLLAFSNTESVKFTLISSLIQGVGKDPAYASPQDWFYALGFSLRGLLSHNYIKSARNLFEKDSRRVYYLSMEYLPGRGLVKTLLDLGVYDIVKEALYELGQELHELEHLEHDPALGNGGLGRLAACILDSMVTQGYPGFGYGIRYNFGLFSQTIENGQQVEHPDDWLRHGDPWEYRRPSVNHPVHFYGTVKTEVNAQGVETSQWIEAEEVMAIAYDMPISGFRSNNVTNLRLWSASATSDFDLDKFNQGDYIKSVEDKTATETLSKILYPDDSTLMGQELRLKQEYFFVSASIQDIVARYLRSHSGLNRFAEKTVIQLNDTHPTLGIAELMRILIDEHDYGWDEAWKITRNTFAYTNHTLLPEALEKWPVNMLKKMLPRHLDIILRINAGFLKEVEARFPGDISKLRDLSLVDDASHCIRMAHLAIVGSHKVNGVAALHTDLLRTKVFPDFDAMYPNKFVNVTNGITPRRWLLQANPELADIINESIGDEWPRDLSQLSKLSDFVDDTGFQDQFSAIKRRNKEKLAKMLHNCMGLRLDPSLLFDIQIKRIHEYKRQLLNVLHVITCYNRIRNGMACQIPRAVLFAGKAAPSYFLAKKIIHLINDVASTINNDPMIGDLLKVGFIPDYRVSLAEHIIPGSELSEQISTAGTEASGTGNMKFALNGALTIGTLDGANVEIKNSVGEDNIFIFGLTADQVSEVRSKGYDPVDYYNGHDELKQVIDMIGQGFFSPGDPDRYKAIVDALLHQGDHYMLFADYESYIDCQKEVENQYLDQKLWTQKAILNVAGMGDFSVDRAVHEYASNIWNVQREEQSEFRQDED